MAGEQEAELVEAIKRSDFEDYGCPYCNFYTGVTVMGDSHSMVLTCGNCSSNFMVLEAGTEKPSIELSFTREHLSSAVPSYSPKVIQHPKPDKKAWDGAPPSDEFRMPPDTC